MSAGLIRSVPFFSGLDADEAARLDAIGTRIELADGDEIDLDDERNLYIVESGLVESVGTSGKGESRFFARASFFGHIPLTAMRPRGLLRAVGSARVFSLDSSLTVRSLILSFKAMRSYIRILGALGFDLTPEAGVRVRRATKVIAVTGEHGIGKTSFAISLAASLSTRGRVLIADISSGSSAFDALQLRITAPLSRREGREIADTIRELVVPHSETLSLLNIANAAEADPSIIAPILFALSADYDYIIFDTGGEDLLAAAIAAADYVIPVIGNAASERYLNRMASERITDGQKVFRALNITRAGRRTSLPGGLLFSRKESALDTAGAEAFADRIAGVQEALILQPLAFSAVQLIPFWAYCMDQRVVFDHVLTSLFASPVSLIAAVSSDADDFIRRCLEFFQPRFINAWLDIRFPDEYISGTGNLLKAMDAVFGKTILEELPVNMITVIPSGASTIRMSTGLLSRVAAAAVCIEPVFAAMNTGAPVTGTSRESMAISCGTGYRMPAEKVTVVQSIPHEHSFFNGVRPFLASSYQTAEQQIRHGVQASFGGNIILDFKNQGNNLGDFIREARAGAPGGIRGMESRTP